MDSRRAEQLEELDGFVSMLECFDGSLEFEKDENGPISGKIRIDFPLLAKPVMIFAEVGLDVQYRMIQALEYCSLLFTLPDAYPSVPPSIEIECSWMNSEKVDAMKKVIDEAAATYHDQPMLYAIAFEVREKACENLERSIRVDNTPYCTANNIEGAAILHRLVEAAATVEQADFERECHDCEVCYENEPGSRCVRFLPCKHVYCERCVHQYFVGLLKDESVRTFECLADSCHSIAAQSTVKKVLGEKEFERYESILLERALVAMDDMAICPRESCGKYAPKSQLTPLLGRCDACAYAFCIKCRKVYHGIDACESHMTAEEIFKLLEEDKTGDTRAELVRKFGGEAALERMISSLISDKWVHENTNKCPKCNSDIQKNGGCNKIRCCKCGTEFCWLCLRKVDADKPYKHFNDPKSKCKDRLFDGLLS